ncbi:hypothetical protein LSH36_13g26067 [Paralvinella palmiformis]|uniref:Uncharacterized protein n=1 Tax=Paralvinella palmiformis TaxID=53620 RepID=A0AAD9KD64_9ANNE|nr:hypothetical protein LSH36_13g26067 [Paralvinella palmiformis]
MAECYVFGSKIQRIMLLHSVELYLKNWGRGCSVAVVI